MVIAGKQIHGLILYCYDCVHRLTSAICLCCYVILYLMVAVAIYFTQQPENIFLLIFVNVAKRQRHHCITKVQRHYIYRGLSSRKISRSRNRNTLMCHEKTTPEISFKLTFVLYDILVTVLQGNSKGIQEPILT